MKLEREHVIAGLTVLSVLLGGTSFTGLSRASEEEGLKDVLREALTAQALAAQQAYENGFEAGLGRCP